MVRVGQFPKISISILAARTKSEGCIAKFIDFGAMWLFGQNFLRLRRAVGPTAQGVDLRVGVQCGKRIPLGVGRVGRGSVKSPSAAQGRVGRGGVNRV